VLCRRRFGPARYGHPRQGALLFNIPQSHPVFIGGCSRSHDHDGRSKRRKGSGYLISHHLPKNGRQKDEERPKISGGFILVPYAPWQLLRWRELAGLERSLSFNGDGGKALFDSMIWEDILWSPLVACEHPSACSISPLSSTPPGCRAAFRQCAVNTPASLSYRLSDLDDEGHFGGLFLPGSQVQRRNFGWSPQGAWQHERERHVSIHDCSWLSRLTTINNPISREQWKARNQDFDSECVKLIRVVVLTDCFSQLSVSSTSPNPVLLQA
jgi:hypothetical protein